MENKLVPDQRSWNIIETQVTDCLKWIWWLYATETQFQCISNGVTFIAFTIELLSRAVRAIKLLSCALSGLTLTVETYFLCCEISFLFLWYLPGTLTSTVCEFSIKIHLTFQSCIFNSSFLWINAKDFKDVFLWINTFIIWEYFLNIFYYVMLAVKNELVLF